MESFVFLLLNMSFLAIKFAVQLSEKFPLLIALRLFGSLKQLAQKSQNVYNLRDF